MAGEPAEAMIGVAALGFGVVLVVAAYKNVSPLALVRQAVTTGKLDLAGLPNLVGKGGTTVIPPDPTSTTAPSPTLTEAQAALTDIAKQTPSLAFALGSNLTSWVKQRPTDTQLAQFKTLTAKARALGMNDDADALDAYADGQAGH